MSKRVFISYCHKQEEWVSNKLVPCLKAGGVNVLIDYEQFSAGRTIIGQMNSTQDSADISLLVLSPDYLKSDMCIYEMKRAIDKDPKFLKGYILPVIVEKCNLPDKIKELNPYHINLCNDKNAAIWGKLMEACEANLGTEVPHWLDVRDIICIYLQDKKSVNLVIHGNPEWKALIYDICKYKVPELIVIDLDSSKTCSRQGLIKEIVSNIVGTMKEVPGRPNDLNLLEDVIEKSKNLVRIAFTHFDNVNYREDYGQDFFNSLRFLINSKKLVLLIESRTPLVQLVPIENSLSTIQTRYVELIGK